MRETNSTPVGPLVDCSWLAEHIDDEELIVVDASWTWAASTARPHESFLEERLPGAIYFDHAKVAAPESKLTDTRASADHFCKRVGALGINPEHTIVVYSQKGTAGGASRAWWLFQSFGHKRVYVLDGGLLHWKALGLSLQSGAPAAPVGCRYVASPDANLVIDLPSLRDRHERGEVQILDARPPGFFAGKGVFASGNEAAKPVEAGRIPESLNLPSSSVVHADTKMMKSPEELLAMLSDLGVDLQRPVVTTCSLGIGACTAALALASVGAPMARVFDGAWEEWGSHESTPKLRDEDDDA